VGNSHPFTFHPGSIGYSNSAPGFSGTLPQAMLRLDLSASGGNVAFSALRVDLSAPAPMNGLYLTLWRDNGDGVFQNPYLGGNRPFDFQLNASAFVAPGVSSAVIVNTNPEMIAP